ncbi:hypothetical protein K1719_034460 [Acacia pycnantha]|nr:hypothetical protein K1719_034460 [Acacia pycnantha]
MDDKTLEGILENCKGLENFSLLESYGFGKLKIHNPNLKILQLNALELDEMVVFAERLEVLLLDTLTFPESLNIYSPSLRVIHSYNNSMLGSMFASDAGKQILKASELLGNYRNFWDSRSNFFLRLSKLSIDMDLNYIQECGLIYAFMGLCNRLETLEVTLPELITFTGFQFLSCSMINAPV